MFEVSALIEHLEQALVKNEAVIYMLQFNAPADVPAHGKMLTEAETAGEEIRAALKVAREIDHAQKYGG